MNAKQLLSILDEDFSDANVEMAIAWLRTKEPTNKSADKVMQRIFGHPKTHTELKWLSEWFLHGSWGCLVHNVSRIQTVEVFDWHLKLLHEHPDHSDANWLCLDLLQEFRNVEVQTAAIEWLRQKKFDDDIAGLILGKLLDFSPTPELIEKAKKVAAEKPEFSLISSLIKNVNDSFSISAGASMLKQDLHPALKFCIVEAMAETDLEANKVYILQFLADKDNQEYAVRLLTEIAVQDAKHLSFICDFIEHADVRTTKHFLKRTRMLFINDDAADTLWSWFKSGERSGKRFEIFITMFETSWCQLPDEAKVFVSDWIARNPKHKLRKSAEITLAREPKNFASRTQVSAFNDVSGGLVSTLVLKANEIDEKSLTTIREWMKNFPITEANVSTIIHVYKITGDPNDIEPLRALLNKGKFGFKTYLLSQLASLDFDDFFELSLQHLAQRNLYKGWWERTNVGNLILELLKARPNDKQVLSHAKKWLTIRPNYRKASVYGEIAAAVAKAGPQTNN